ncbi:hypothetical protein Aperf_G00000061723 [Anoplocephala perfoliata]
MHFGAKGLTYVANTAITTAMKSQDLIIHHLNQRSLSLDDIGPLSLQKPSGDASFTHQSSKGGYGRPSRTRFSTTIPLDNVKEVTDEEGQITDSTDAGDTKQREPNQKSTDAGVIKPFKPHPIYLRSNTEPVEVYTSNLRPVVSGNERCPVPVSPRASVSSTRQIFRQTEPT